MFSDASNRNYGLLLGALLIALGIMFHLLEGIPRGVIGFLIFIAGPAILLLKIRSEKNDGSESFWESFKPALVIFTIGVTLYGIFVFVLNGVIDGSYLLEVQQDALADIERRGLEGQAYEDAAELTQILSRPIPFAVSIMLQLWLGFAVLALPLVAIMRRRAMAS